MFTVIKYGSIYNSIEHKNCDILICGNKIVHVGTVEASTLPDVEKVIDARGKYVVPGFIDQHVHITGGGGEAGPASRTPEISLTELTSAGITTVVGLLGFDGVTRSMYELVAKARALESEGISTFVYSGAYQLPIKTITGSIPKDIVLIDKVLGLGEIAIADHRASPITYQELADLGAQARYGSLLSGKAGVVHLHVGDGKSGLELLFEINKRSDLPLRHFVPTHLNRKKQLYTQALDYAALGGHLDITAGFYPDKADTNAFSVSEAIRKFKDTGLPLEQLTVSSDGNGSIPVFNQHGNIESYNVGSVSVLWTDLRQSILDGDIGLEEAVKLISENVANLLLLKAKGQIAPNFDADLNILDRDLKIDTVLAKGKLMVLEKESIINTPKN